MAVFDKTTNNIEYTVDDDGIMVLKIDTKDNLGLSGSGKNTMMASSKGNKPVQLPDGRTVSIGINIYYK